jgi:hypothetical protein
LKFQVLRRARPGPGLHTRPKADCVKQTQFRDPGCEPEGELCETNPISAGWGTRRANQEIGVPRELTEGSSVRHAPRYEQTQFAASGHEWAQAGSGPCAGSAGLQRAKQTQFRVERKRGQVLYEKRVTRNPAGPRPRKNKANSRRRRVGRGLKDEGRCVLPRSSPLWPPAFDGPIVRNKPNSVQGDGETSALWKRG